MAPTEDHHTVEQAMPGPQRDLPREVQKVATHSVQYLGVDQEQNHQMATKNPSAQKEPT